MPVCRMLVLQMRAAAFLPVVLSLASVVARGRALMAELDPLLRQAQEATHLLTQVHEQAQQTHATQPKLKQSSPDNGEKQLSSRPRQLDLVTPGKTTAKVNSGQSSKQKNKKETSRNIGPRDEIDEIFGF